MDLWTCLGRPRDTLSDSLGVLLGMCAVPPLGATFGMLDVAVWASWSLAGGSGQDARGRWVGYRGMLWGGCWDEARETQEDPGLAMGLCHPAPWTIGRGHPWAQPHSTGPADGQDLVNGSSHIPLLAASLLSLPTRVRARCCPCLVLPVPA